MDSVKVTIQDNILPYLQVINDGDDLALKKFVGADIAKLLLGLEGGYCMEYKYRDKKETYYEKI